jgi:hypothetical protein
MANYGAYIIPNSRLLCSRSNALQFVEDSKLLGGDACRALLAIRIWALHSMQLPINATTHFFGNAACKMSYADCTNVILSV